MWRAHWRLFPILLAMTTGAAGQSAGEGQLARFREKIRQDMTSIPNYTCLETIERAVRTPRFDFRPAGTVRLEVSSVAGKELFAKPGAARFEDGDVESLVPHGVIGSGVFATFARDLFVKGKGTLYYKHEKGLAGHDNSVRYDFRLKRQDSALKLQVANFSAMVAARGSFWFDPVSLDLIRLELHGEDMPHDLHLMEAVARTDYARVHVGDSDALLPKRSEISMTYYSGAADRDVIEFSQCHEYRAESTIDFAR
jgi:hypothetical protein